MSKSLVKQGSKEIVIPAHATEVASDNHALERIINTGVMSVFNLPTLLPLFTDVQVAVGPSTLGFMGFLLCALTIPTMSGTHPETKTFREGLNVQMAKVPVLNLFANQTFAAKVDDKDVIVKMKYGNSVIYDVTQPNPKELWDKMYESETGSNVHDDLALV